MKYLTVGSVYEKDGVQKTRWERVGVLFESKGRQFIKLHMFPNLLINVFEDDKAKANPDRPFNPASEPTSITTDDLGSTPF